MNDGRSVVLLTGASGFVGRNVALALRSSELTVKRAIRFSSTSNSTLQSDAVLIDAIGPQADWNEALSGVDAVIHLAARVHHPGEERATDLYHRINTAGTLHLAQCAAKAGVRHFIFLSTALVNGSCTDGRAPFRETDDPLPRGIYGASKAAAEAGLVKIARETKLAVTVIRPPLIYGPGAGGNFKLLATAVKRGIPLPFGSIRNRRAFLGVENLASFIVHRLEHPCEGFHTFLVADDEQVSTPDFARNVANALGRKSWIVPAPQFALKALFAIIGRPEAGDSICASLEMDVSESLKTGWRPPFTLSEGLRRSFQ